MKEFRIGDKVWDLVKGNGVVKQVRLDAIYGVKVDFDGRVVETYMLDGRQLEEDIRPSLYHGHNLSFEIKRPKKGYVNLYWDVYPRSTLSGGVYETKGKVLEYSKFHNYITTVEIEIPAGAE